MSKAAARLSVKELQHKYGDRPVIEGLTFTLAAGQAIALVGPNGAGKTTVLKCIVGSAEPAAGTILLDGLPIDERADAVRRDVATLLDDLDFFPDLTAAEHRVSLSLGREPATVLGGPADRGGHVVVRPGSRTAAGVRRTRWPKSSAAAARARSSNRSSPSNGGGDGSFQVGDTLAPRSLRGRPSGRIGETVGDGRPRGLEQN